MVEQWLLPGVLTGGGLLILIVTVLAFRHERRKRELEHIERVKSLEAGLPLPDAEVARAKAAGIATTLIGMAAMSAAGVGTWLVLPRLEEPQQLIAALGIIWGCAAGVGVLAALVGLSVLRRPASGEGPKKTVRYD
jgi:hypothetical protein